MLAYWDRQERCWYANDAYVAWFGRTAAEMIGIQASELLGPLYELNKPFIRAALRGEPQEFERQITLPTGEVRDSLIVYTPDISDGRVRGFIAHVSDVTGVKDRLNRLREADERVRMERAERVQADRLQWLMSKVGVGLIVQGPAAELLMCNPAALALLGLREDQLRGDAPLDSSWNAIAEDGTPIESLPKLIHRAFTTRTSVHDVVLGVFRPSRGDRVWLLLNAEPQLTDDGIASEVICTIVDLTQHTQTEQQSRQSQKMESVGRLAGGVAHDFNNLLTVINTTAELALGCLDPSSPLHRDLTEIRRAGDRASALTQQLLAFSRRQILAPTALDLNHVVEDLHSMLRRLVPESVDLRVEANAPSSYVRADRSQIEQLIMNLVANAVDAMPEGGRLTITTTQQADREQPCVSMCITDTGNGMDEATRARIFDPFFSTKYTPTNTGLGLATVYGVVQQSGGTITVDSAPLQGTTFKIELPLISPPKDEARRTLASHSNRSSAGNAETILVVEDEDGVRRLIERILSGAGYQVISAENGEDALLKADAHDGNIHLLVTDVVMPGINGRELATRLSTRHSLMRVLYTSGYTEDSILRAGVFNEAANFLAKPYSRDQLSAKVREVLDVQSRDESDQKGE